MTIYRNSSRAKKLPTRKIKFVSAPCATGKTHAVCQHIRDNLARRNFIYCGRTIELIRETERTLADLGVRTTAITSDDSRYEFRVKKEIAKFISKAKGRGNVLLITANARIDLTHSVPASWQVFFDEVPQTDSYYPWMLPRNQAFITDYLEPEDDAVEGRLLVKMRQKFFSQLEGIVRSVPDDIDKQMIPFYLDSMSPGKEMFTHFESYERVCEREEVAIEHGLEKANKVHFISMLQPEPFIGATILGANIEDSLFYHWMRDWHCVEFVENTEISRRLRKLPENIGQRLKVSYFIPGKRFGSKYLFSQQASEDDSNLERMNCIALAEFGDEPFLYVPNNDTVSPIEQETNCTRAPVVCHGLNRYSNCHNVYCPVALNREPFHLQMLEKGFGLSKEVIHRGTAQEMIYQIVSRTSLRDFGSTAIVRAIVPDYTTARRLADLYGSTQVSQIGELFEKKPPLSNAEKQRRYRARLKAAKTSDLALSSIEPPKAGDVSLVMTVTMCDDRFAKSREEHSENIASISDFIGVLHDQSTRTVTEKEGGLFNLSVFDPPEGAEGYRRLEHFKSASGLVLDFDNGEVTPMEFERIFWSEAGRGRKMSFTIMNTFSRSEGAPNKFRVVIPFSRPARSVEEFHAAYDHIVRRIEERGYRKPPRVADGPILDAGGLDRSSRSPTQIFYWSCTNASHPEGAFFRSFGLQKRELARHALDPHRVAETSPIPLLEVLTPPPVGNVDQAKVDAVIRQWRDVGVAPGNGNDGFFRLGLGLAKAGLPHHEVERILKEEARYAHTPKDRLRNVPHVMRNL